MRYGRLGRTGLGVSPIALGTMGLGLPTSKSEAAQLIHDSLELGVNFLDTANCYDGVSKSEIKLGHAESMLGEVLADGLRHEFVIVSKVGVPLRPGPQHRGLSATHILRELENSLRRIKTDYLDIFLAHWPDAFAHPDEVLRAMDQAVSSGKTRYVGVSNFLAWQVCEYLWAADRRNWPAVCVNELPVSVLERRYENDLPFYEAQEVGVVAYQALQAGLLSDRRLQTLLAASQASDHQERAQRRKGDQLSVLLELSKLAASLDLTLAELSIAWAASQKAVVSVVLGARSKEQLASGLKAAQFSLTADVRERIDQLCPAPPKPQPRFLR